MDMQEALDKAYALLCEHENDCKAIWDLNLCKKWGKAPATDSQKDLIRKRGKKYLSNSDIDIEDLTKFEASQILNRIMKG